MLHWLLIPTVAVSIALGGEPDIASGPRSPEEAQVLFNEGKAYFEKSAFPRAIISLKRMTERYPGAAGYIQAQTLLGFAYFRTNQPEKAIAPFKTVIGALKRLPSQDPGAVQLPEIQLALGRCYLKTKKPQQAYLLALEMEKSDSAAALTPSQILKARAQMALKQDAAAETTIAAFLPRLNPPLPDSIRADGFLAELEHKLNSCGKLPGKGPLEEEQARDRLKRRGTCLAEASLLVKKSLDTHDPDAELDARALFLASFQAYRQAVLNPPAPPTIIHGLGKKRSTQQVHEYRKELSLAASADFSEKLRETIALLEGYDKISLPLKKLELPTRP